MSRAGSGASVPAEAEVACSNHAGRIVEADRVTSGEVRSAALRGKCPFDSRDDVQERDYPGNLEDPFYGRRSPQHDIELAIEFNGVFLRLQEYTDDRGVDELDG